MDDAGSDESAWLWSVDLVVPLAILLTSLIELYALAVTKAGDDNKLPQDQSLVEGKQSIFLPIPTQQQHQQHQSMPMPPCPPFVTGGIE